MEAETRKRMLKSFGAAPDQLAAALKAIDSDLWQQSPAPNEWNIRQIIFHLADSEANYYVRLRKGIAESGGMVVAFDQDLWSNALDYPGRSTDEALALFRLLRTTSHQLLVQLPEKVWTNWVQHSERGKLTLEDLVRTGENHVAEHLKQIEATVKRLRNQ
jgi:uncharacterized damage-inducible protein DinB